MLARVEAECTLSSVLHHSANRVLGAIAFGAPESLNEAGIREDKRANPPRTERTTRDFDPRPLIKAGPPEGGHYVSSHLSHLPHPAHPTHPATAAVPSRRPPGVL